jgi:hypothetical protein
MLPDSLASSPYSPLLLVPVFGWLLHVKWSFGGRLRPGYIIILFIFSSFESPPKSMRQCPPIRSSPRVTPLQHTPYRFCQLLVGCCVLPLNGGHLRPMHHIPQYFFVWFQFAPQTGEPAIAPPNPTMGALHGTIGSHSAIGWWCQKPAHGERWQSWWRVGWRQLILVVVCCVLCVVCCGCNEFYSYW